jgi:hypothetical protein
MIGIVFWILFILVYMLAVLVAAKAILTVIFTLAAPKVQPARVRPTRQKHLRRAA